MSSKIKKIVIGALPFIAIALTILFYFVIPNTGKQKKTAHPYFVYLNIVFAVILAILLIVGIFNPDFRKKTLFKFPFYTGLVVFLSLLNLVVTKTKLLPVLFFPSLDRITAILWEQKLFLIQNVIFSFGLLIEGFIFGLVTGFFTGLALGYNQKVGYWLNPVTKFLGPVPTTAWIPLALSVFPTTHAANVFLIAFAVWFPVTLMTASGIQSVKKVYFEVSETLGANTLTRVFKVAVPSSLSQIFLGLFYGIVSSFATLMAVEMNGNSSGIGWYINWQKSVMQYDGVYAGLIIIAVLCSLILTLLFKVRDRIMVWQKGVIRW